MSKYFLVPDFKSSDKTGYYDITKDVEKHGVESVWQSAVKFFQMALVLLEDDENGVINVLKEKGAD